MVLWFFGSFRRLYDGIMTDFFHSFPLKAGEVTSEERATFDKERNLLYQQLDEKDGEINNQSQLISRLQVSCWEPLEVER